MKFLIGFVFVLKVLAVVTAIKRKFIFVLSPFGPYRKKRFYKKYVLFNFDAAADGQISIAFFVVDLSELCSLDVEKHQIRQIGWMLLNCLNSITNGGAWTVHYKVSISIINIKHNNETWIRSNKNYHCVDTNNHFSSADRRFPNRVTQCWEYILRSDSATSSTLRRECGKFNIKIMMSTQSYDLRCEW